MKEALSRVERFEGKFVPEPNSGCWLWIGGCCSGGYGTFFYGLDHKRDNMPCIIGAHRMSWILYNGELPSESWVCHRCDNPACVNPDHLFLGDSKINVEDKIAKGRGGKYYRGEENHRSKLTNEEILLISNDLRPQKEIAKSYNISQGHVSRIKRGVVWPTVSDRLLDLRVRAIGARANKSKLTDADIIAIRGDRRPHKDIAKEFSISISAIGKIKARKTWRHVR